MRNGLLVIVLLSFIFSGNVFSLTEDDHEYKRAIQLIPKVNQEVKKIIHKGNVFFAQKEYTQAIKMFDLARKSAWYHPIPYFLLAKTYFHIGNDDAAFQALEMASGSQTDMDWIFQKMDEENIEISDIKISHEKVFIAPFKDNKKSAVSFMFDDGAENVYSQILPLFDAFDFKATIPINPGLITEKVTNPWWGSWEQWRDAYKRGFEISNHAMEHYDLTQVDDEALEGYINDSYYLIQEKIGAPPLSFVFPQDRSNKKVIAKASERHLVVRHHEILTQVYDSILIMIYGGDYFSVQTGEKLIDLALKKRLWLTAECHSIATEDIKTYKPITIDFLQKHLSYIKEREDQIWVDTFLNVYSYLSERKKTTIEWKEKGENSVVFKLKNMTSKKSLKMPLTVVINTSPFQPTSAIAVQKETKKRIPIQIKEKALHVYAFSGESSIEVVWK